MTATCSSAIRSSKLQLCCLIEDLGAPLVAKLLAHRFQLLHDQTPRSFGLRRQNGFVLGNALPHFDQFLDDLIGRKLGEAVELQFENGVDLPVAQAALALRPGDDAGVELEHNVLGQGEACAGFPWLLRAIPSPE